jgi:hypothetical protein
MKLTHAAMLWCLVLCGPRGGAAGEAAAPSYSGAWETTYGPMTLTQQNDQVEGSYVMQGQKCLLKGRLQGGRLGFTYQEPHAAGHGWFDLTSGGNGFSGKYWEDGAKEWGDWQGKRAPAPATNFQGLWDSSYGRLRLLQTGDEVRGTYAYADGSSLVGKAQGRSLAFSYREPTAAGEGLFQLSADAKAIHGKWRPSGAARWSDWNATRVLPKPDRLWLVVIESPWEQSLDQREYSFGAMLRAFFSRSPNVEVRQRLFSDQTSFCQSCREIAYLAEPVVLSVAAHGSPAGVTAGRATIGPEAIAEGLRYAENLRLLHFSACSTMAGDLPEKIKTALGGKARFAISGYTTPVDWAASAVLEFMYFDLVLCRGLEPAKAAEQLRILMPFAGPQDLPGAALKSAGFRIVGP